MATESKRELIVQKILEYLNLIKTASGYWNDPKTVERTCEQPEELDDVDFPAIYIEEGIETSAQTSYQKVECDLELHIFGYVKVETNRERAIGRLLKDVKKAILTDLDVNGLARLNKYTSNSVAIAKDDTIAGFDLTLSLNYKVAMSDP